MENHPDKGGDRAKFDAIQAAYSVLSDPAQRAAYDSPSTSQPQTDAAATTARHRQRPESQQPPSHRRPTFSDAQAPINTPPYHQEVPKVGLVYVFKDGVRVEISDMNQNGAYVPSDLQRRVYRMGPAFVYKRLLPNDRMWRVAPPLPPIPPHLQNDPRVHLSALSEGLLAGPRWFKPKLSWLATIVLLFALPIAVVGSLVSSSSLHPAHLAALLVFPFWWPAPRAMASLWARLPGWYAAVGSASMLAMLATGPPVSPLAAAVWMGTIATSFLLVVVLRRLRAAAPVFFTTRFS